MRIAFLSFLLVIVLAIIFSKSIIRAIIMLSVFSVISSLLYFLYQAPDVAMAELAIGAAVVPLIYVISITRQKKYIVIDNTKDRFLEQGMTGHMLLSQFCKSKNLELVVLREIPEKESFLFSKKDIDLIVERDSFLSGTSISYQVKPCDRRYVFKGSQSSYIFNDLKQQLLKSPCAYARIESIEEGETDD
ncbi:DUF4040 domain-containing protein [Clostridia bacterium]|nr:DUF4040 domain-containing protein [Clostridia bacterium]